MVSGKDFPGGPLVKILVNCRGKGSITGQGTLISCAAQQKKKKKRKKGFLLRADPVKNNRVIWHVSK